MTDLDQRITSALRERAESNVDTDRLTAGAVTRGRSRVRRRRAVAGTALGVAALLGVGVATGPIGLPFPGQPATSTASAGGAVAPPPADGVPGAAARPDQIGADPAVLHFGVAPDGPRYLSWAVQDGVERVRVGVGGDRTVTVEIAGSAGRLLATSVDGLPMATSVDGLPMVVAAPERPGAFAGAVTHETVSGKSIWLRHWQPAPGVYARASVTAENHQDLLDVAPALRLDRAYRCAAPVQLTALPEGARVVGCEVTLANFPATFSASLVLARGQADRMRVELGYDNDSAGTRAKGNRTIGDRPAYLSPQGDQLELLGLPKAHLVASFGGSYRGFTEADATKVLGGARVAEDLTRPETW
ncbi:hypothetical protein OG559_17355 [Micromonospora sp. NBC_01405]|uniref:hypothetical protein n=1 Tax=Micromonospora sp. NBC_01405 TaxID=2903589 RepID=UPI00324DB731